MGHLLGVDKYRTAIEARFIAAEELVRAGWITAPTIDNAPLADLLAVEGKMRLAIAVSVKGRSAKGNKKYWPIKTTLRKKPPPKSSSFYYAFVDNPTREVYWVPSMELPLKSRDFVDRRTRKMRTWYRVYSGDIESYLRRIPT
ncbi:MAG: hypothetical protein WAN74_07520 [Thermoplasmata archaeon]